MKKKYKFYTLVLFFFVINLNAQFLHLRAGQESKDPVTIIFENGAEKNGFIKNNEPKNKVLRAISFNSNSSAFSNPELSIDYILFKESEVPVDYAKIDVSTIKHVIFSNTNSLVYDKFFLYDINEKTLEIDYSNPKQIFFQANNLKGFKRYIIFTRMTERGKTVMYTPYYYIKSPTKNELVAVNPWSMVSYNRVVNYFKFLGSDCKPFLDYLTRSEDRNSVEFKEFKRIRKAFKSSFNKEIKKTFKDNKKKKIDNEYLYQEKGIRDYEFLFDYMYQKYLDYNCKS